MPHPPDTSTGSTAAAEDRIDRSRNRLTPPGGVDGSHREPCAHCRRWQYPIAQRADGERVDVLYRCRDCGREWWQERDYVNHRCGDRCRKLCKSPRRPGR